MEHLTSDPVDALLAHNRWATAVILEQCRELSSEDFRRPFPIGPADHGGLCAILTHIIGAMRRWADRLAERPPRPPLEHWRRDPASHDPAPARADAPDDLLALLDVAHADLVEVIAEARRKGVERTIRIPYATPEGPRTFSFTAGVGIASAAVHGHYHRAQCMNILRRLGKKGPPLDVIDWEEAIT